jgi:hypothetical protein
VSLPVVFTFLPRSVLAVLMMGFLSFGEVN